MFEKFAVKMARNQGVESWITQGRRRLYRVPSEYSIILHVSWFVYLLCISFANKFVPGTIWTWDYWPLKFRVSDLCHKTLYVMSLVPGFWSLCLGIIWRILFKCCSHSVGKLGLLNGTEWILFHELYNFVLFHYVFMIILMSTFSVNFYVIH